METLRQTNDIMLFIFHSRQGSNVANKFPNFVVMNNGCKKAVIVKSVQARTHSSIVCSFRRRLFRKYAAIIVPFATLPTTDSEMLAMITNTFMAK
jgi:hypothetical protein